MGGMEAVEVSYSVPQTHSSACVCVFVLQQVNGMQLGKQAIFHSYGLCVAECCIFKSAKKAGD